MGESDHPKNLAKDQEMRKNIRNAHFKTTFKVCIDYTSRSKIISIFSLLCYNSLNWHCCILNKTKKWSLKFLTNLQTDLPLFLNIPADVFLAEKPTPTEGGETVLVELTSPEAITSPQGVSSYVEGVDALDEDVQVVRRYQAADGT